MVENGRPTRVNILGVGVSAVNMASAIAEIDRVIETGRRSYVCVTSVHGVVDSRFDPDLRTIHNQADLVVPDGKPLVWVCRMTGYRHVSQVCGPDLLPTFCEHSVAKGYGHFFFGGAPEVPKLLQKALCQRFPGLKVVGTLSPPFRPTTPEEDEAIIANINDANPDLVWVGLSTPKQERWMALHRDRLNAPVLLGVGAAFDFNAGLKKVAPKFMRRIGIEWFFRMISEPRRLGRRYARIVPMFLFLTFLQQTGLKSYSLKN